MTPSNTMKPLQVHLIQQGWSISCAQSWVHATTNFVGSRKVTWRVGICPQQISHNFDQTQRKKSIALTWLVLPRTRDHLCHCLSPAHPYRFRCLQSMLQGNVVAPHVFLRVRLYANTGLKFLNEICGFGMLSSRLERPCSWRARRVCVCSYKDQGTKCFQYFRSNERNLHGLDINVEIRTRLLCLLFMHTDVATNVYIIDHFISCWRALSMKHSTDARVV